eukprot:TRINITY_DN73393_c0_g1_i1.p1 TRINITY_DN73393_c0_g1~~TRINITY_DN73393_c0_g1_i1.p1  ORF type:complete len:582 (+),score=183.70 TRINITY_DN73393_c0_g1_i1:92-1747(+)
MAYRPGNQEMWPPPPPSYGAAERMPMWSAVPWSAPGGQGYAPADASASYAAAAQQPAPLPRSWNGMVVQAPQQREGAWGQAVNPAAAGGGGADASRQYDAGGSAGSGTARLRKQQAQDSSAARSLDTFLHPQAGATKAAAVPGSEAEFEGSLVDALRRRIQQLEEEIARLRQLLLAGQGAPNGQSGLWLSSTSQLPPTETPDACRGSPDDHLQLTTELRQAEERSQALAEVLLRSAAEHEAQSRSLQAAAAEARAADRAALEAQLEELRNALESRGTGDEQRAREVEQADQAEQAELQRAGERLNTELKAEKMRCRVAEAKQQETARNLAAMEELMTDGAERFEAAVEERSRFEERLRAELAEVQRAREQDPNLLEEVERLKAHSEACDMERQRHERAAEDVRLDTQRQRSAWKTEMEAAKRREEELQSEWEKLTKGGVAKELKDSRAALGAARQAEAALRQEAEELAMQVEQLEHTVTGVKRRERLHLTSTESAARAAAGGVDAGRTGEERRLTSEAPMSCFSDSAFGLSDKQILELSQSDALTSSTTSQ